MLPLEIKILLLLLEILGEDVYDNRNRRADEVLIDRANHVNGVRDNLNSSIK